MGLNRKMTILIGYDGSVCADRAIDDLSYAGLPVDGVAHVLSIAESWLPDPQSFGARSSTTSRDPIAKSNQKHGEKALSEARILADHATRRVRGLLPGWEVKSHTAYGSPSREIVGAANKLDVDLIIMGSQGHSTLTPCSIGSIANKVLVEANCSVRLVHATPKANSAPTQIVVGFDGSEGSRAAIDAIAERCWTPGTVMKLIAVTEPTEPRSLDRFVQARPRRTGSAAKSGSELLGPLSDIDEQMLARCGLATSMLIRAGNPKHVLIDEAWRSNADAIIVGANLWGANIENARLGSTAAAIAARANCTVEVVRKRSAGRLGVVSDSDDRADHVAPIKHTRFHDASMVRGNPW